MQKARINWLRQGDSNTKFYHLMTKWRRSLSGLNGLRLNGQWCEDSTIIKERVKEFFRDMFRDE